MDMEKSSHLNHNILMDFYVFQTKCPEMNKEKVLPMATSASEGHFLWLIYISYVYFPIKSSKPLSVMEICALHLQESNKNWS